MWWSVPFPSKKNRQELQCPAPRQGRSFFVLARHEDCSALRTYVWGHCNHTAADMGLKPPAPAQRDVHWRPPNRAAGNSQRLQRAALERPLRERRVDLSQNGPDLDLSLCLSLSRSLNLFCASETKDMRIWGTGHVHPPGR